MAETGFFHLTGDRYQMTVPQEISGSKIEAALLKLAASEDPEYNLHPEQFVSCLSKADIQSGKYRIRKTREGEWK